MLSRFHLIAERNGQTDRRTDLPYQYRASVLTRDKKEPQIEPQNNRQTMSATCYIAISKFLVTAYIIKPPLAIARAA